MYTRKSTQKLLIDTFIVIAVSILAFVLKDLAMAQGWIAIGAEARGIFSVLGGAIAAVGLVLTRGGAFADLGFRPRGRWAIVPIQVAGILVDFIAVRRQVAGHTQSTS